MVNVPLVKYTTRNIFKKEIKCFFYTNCAEAVQVMVQPGDPFNLGPFRSHGVAQGLLAGCITRFAAGGSCFHGNNR